MDSYSTNIDININTTKSFTSRSRFSCWFLFLSFWRAKFHFHQLPLLMTSRENTSDVLHLCVIRSVFGMISMDVVCRWLPEFSQMRPRQQQAKGPISSRISSSSGNSTTTTTNDNVTEQPRAKQKKKAPHPTTLSDASPHCRRYRCYTHTHTHTHLW